jgi:hypothetical protein
MVGNAAAVHGVRHDDIAMAPSIATENVAHALWGWAVRLGTFCTSHAAAGGNAGASILATTLLFRGTPRPKAGAKP